MRSPRPSFGNVCARLRRRERRADSLKRVINLTLISFMRATFRGTEKRSEENKKKRSVRIHHIIIIIVLESFYLSRFVSSQSY